MCLLEGSRGGCELLLEGAGHVLELAEFGPEPITCEGGFLERLLKLRPYRLELGPRRLELLVQAVFFIPKAIA